MPKQDIIKKEEVFVCDYCSNKEVIEGKNEWLKINLVETKALRLMEKVAEVIRYESFHIPNKKIVYFCNKNCAKNFLLNSVDLFLAELAR